MMHPEYTKSILTLLEQQMRDTRAAFHRGVPGVTYEDMAASAERLLRMRVCVEKATGRPVTTQVTKRAIASLLR